MTTPLTLRTVKGSELEWAEVDGNFTALRARADSTRELPQSAVNLYVRPDGSDANDGSANDSGHAFLTIQRAATEARKYDTHLAPVKINLAAGTYAGALALSGGVFAPYPDFDVQIIGNIGNPASVVLTGTVTVSMGTFWIRGVTFSGAFLSSSNYGSLTIEEVRLVSCTVYASYFGYAGVGGNVEVSGNKSAAFYLYNCGQMYIWGVTVVGTPAYSTAFMECHTNSVVDAESFAGSATGKRYVVDTNAVINTFGGGANVFPGNVAGTTATGGQYV